MIFEHDLKFWMVHRPPSVFVNFQSPRSGRVRTKNSHRGVYGSFSRQLSYWTHQLGFWWRVGMVPPAIAVPTTKPLELIRESYAQYSYHKTVGTNPRIIRTVRGKGVVRCGLDERQRALDRENRIQGKQNRSRVEEAMDRFRRQQEEEGPDHP